MGNSSHRFFDLFATASSEDRPDARGANQKQASQSNLDRTDRTAAGTAGRLTSAVFSDRLPVSRLSQKEVS